MFQKHLQFSFAFAFIFVAQIFLELDNKTAKAVIGDFQYAIKPLITISLMVYLTYQTQLKGRFSKRIFIGLIFGLIGDSFLMFTHIEPAFFTYGLIAFLGGHIAYVTAFFIDYAWAPKIRQQARIWGIIFFGAFGIGFYLMLYPNLGNLKIPVAFYAFAISLMGLLALNRLGRVNTDSFNSVFFGALLFILSDSVLAYNKFADRISGVGVIVMITYMIAQYLITIGAADRKLKKHSRMEMDV
jgi:uncharacterized membrane protein YhhN